jgi:hypothetical protein
MSNKVEVADEAATVIVAHPDFDPLENDRLYSESCRNSRRSLSTRIALSEPVCILSYATAAPNIE